MRWRAAIAAAGILVALVVTTRPTAATTATDGACPAGVGVTVVVNFQSLGGGTIVRCAAGTPADGFDALRLAGFKVDRVFTQPGFLCRIEGKPSPAQEGCQVPPGVESYWSYWHASSAGGEWVYSLKGADDTRPVIGSAEGWSFGVDTDTYEPLKPSERAPAAAATPATTVTTAKPVVDSPPATSQPRKAPTVATSVLGATVTAAPTMATATSPVASSTTLVGVEPTTTAAPANDDRARVQVAAANARAPRRDDSSSGTPLATAGGVALIAAVGGGVAVARRRARGPASDA